VARTTWSRSTRKPSGDERERDQSEWPRLRLDGTGDAPERARSTARDGPGLAPSHPRGIPDGSPLRRFGILRSDRHGDPTRPAGCGGNQLRRVACLGRQVQSVGIGRRTAVHWIGFAVALVVAVGVPSGVASAAPSAPTMSASTVSGPVGTVVQLRGTAGAGCNGTSFLNFGMGTTGPTEFIVVPVASDGEWSATFVIPPFVGYLATRGYPGADVTPGAWEFQGPVCTGQAGTATTVSFQVTGTSSAQPQSRFVGMAATTDSQGYWLAQSGGGVFAFGDAGFHGALPAGTGGLGIIPAAPISGIASTPDGGGYWLVGQDGGVFAFGDAGFFGSLPSAGIRPFGAVVGITRTPDGHGYWLQGADGGVFSFGDAGFYGTASTGVAVTGLLSTPDGKGYLTIPANGDAPLALGDGAVPANRPSGPMTLSTLLSGGSMTTTGKGVWEVGTDGGVFTSGDAGFFGSLPATGVAPAAPIVGMVPSDDGGGYWLLGADGGVFAFGNAGYLGSAGASGLAW
jgi:hypothetical protein